MTSILYKHARNIDAVGGLINEGMPSFFSLQQPHEMNCGLHALNNIVQDRCFSSEYLNSIEEEEFGPKYSEEVVKCGYSLYTLLRALNEHGYECTPAPKLDKKELGEKYLALLCSTNNIVINFSSYHY